MPPVHSKKPCSDCMFADGGECEKHFAEGGEVMRKNGKGEREVAGESGHSRGVHWQNRGVGSEAGTSHAGMHTKTNSRFPSEVRDEHKSVLREMKSMKGPTSGRSGFAEGGDVDGNTLEDPMKPAGDDMSDMIVDELMDAFEKKDKQGVKDAIEALVMECMNKGGHDE